MKKSLWIQNYTINTFLVNPQKKLGLYGLLNLIQDTAWIHATHLGHGYEEMIRDETAWVLTRQQLVMHAWPLWGEEVQVRTWVRPITGVVATRDFQIFRGELLLGECSTQWLILDLKTRKPAHKSLKMSEDEFLSDAPVIKDATKISSRKDFIKLSEFNVRNSDLDLNGHVNNTRYAQWILDAISMEKHREYSLKEYGVNFLSETHSGDTITICSSTLDADEIIFRGVRNQDQKIVFVASLKVSAQQMPP